MDINKVELHNIYGKRLAIVGGRDFKDKELLNSTLEKYRDSVGLVVSGGAPGADTLGEGWADRHCIPKLIFPANWEKFNKRAGFTRNQYIANNCDACVAFWDGESKGTRSTVEMCKKLQIPIKIVVYLKK